ncbi:MAG TPA: MCE family protein [Pseudonocardiaceae bacterium]|jgi:virulence factor Mce-like protein
MTRWFGRGGARTVRVIALVCVVGLLGTAGVWWLTRGHVRHVTGYFSSAVAVFPDNEVQILGVPVGRVTSVQPQGPVVKVEMEIDDSVQVPASASAVEVSPSLVTGRNIQLTPAYTGGPVLADGAVIPLQRTAVPLGVDDLVRTADQLATMLGPHGVNQHGVNQKGALADLLDVGAGNLAGNGQALHDTIGNLAQLSGTLSGSRQDLFGTVTQLQSFVSTLAASDGQVRQFNTQLADVSHTLADERGDLGAALNQLSGTLGEVAGFVQDNRAVLKSNVDRLSQVTAVLVAQRNALAEILDVAPTGLNNVANAYNASSGTLDTRANLEELRAPPILLVCELLRRSTPAQLPPNLAQTCRQLEPELSGAVPLPSAAEVISALETGQPPPLPLLAVPTVARPR